jgi:transcriptional regulator CtsR
MPTAKQLADNYKYMAASKANYDSREEKYKIAFWEYATANKALPSYDKMSPSLKTEYDKYVGGAKIYGGEVSQKLYQPSEEDKMANPDAKAFFYKDLKSDGLDYYERLQMNPNRDSMTQKPQPTSADKRRLLNEQRLEELTPTAGSTAIKNPIKKSKSGLLNFINATSGKAVNTIFGTDYNQIDSMGKGMDTTTDVTGAILGYTAPMGEAGSLWNAAGKITNAAGKAVGKIVPKAVTNAAGKIATTKAGNVAMNIGKKALEGAPTGAILDTLQGVQRGESKEQILNRAGQGLVIGAGANIGLSAIGKAISGLRAGKLTKIPVPEVAATKTSLKPETNIISKGAYKVKNTRLEKAIGEYNNAIETIQNHFQTNELRSDEMSRIKTEIGIDLDSLVKNMEDAEKGVSVSEIGQRRNLSNVAGATDLPKINKAPIANPKLSVDINSLPIENKPLAGRLNAQGEAAIAKEVKPSTLRKNLGKFYSATVNNTQATANVSKEAEIMSNVTRNAGATVDTIIKKGLVNMEGKPIEGKAIADIFNMPEKEAQALEDLLFETHNIDRVKQGKELTSHTTEESKLIIDNIKKQYPQLEAKAKEVNTLLKNMLDEWGVRSGLVDADLRNLVQGMYKNYVPGYRELAGVDATSFKSRGMGAAKIINKAIGGDDKLMSLQKSIPMLINKTVKAARKNELYYEILKAAEKGSPYAKVLEPAGKIEEVVAKNATDKMIEAIKADGIDALADITDSALTADPKLGYLLTVMDKGKPVKLQIREELFKSLQALNGKGDDDLQVALKLFKKTVTNPFKSLITGYNPLFAIRNVARDIPTAYIQGTENNPFKFAKNLGSAAKDMFKNADEFQEYKALGGEGGNYFNVEKGIKAEGKLEKVLKPLGKINNFTETWPRYAEYKGTLKREGTDYGTKMKALHNAQEVTVNFGKHGDVVKAIDAVVPYLNPAVQGLDKTRRTFMKPEAWAKALGVITVPTAAIYAINQIVDKKGYDQLDNRTKDTNFVFPMGDGTFVKIPKTRESGAVFGALFERVLRQVEKQPESFEGYGSTIKTNFLIQNPWADNIASPLVSGIGYNKDFAGRNVVPQYMLNDKRSPKLQYDERTSEIAKEIGDKFNLSPKQVDYIIKSYTGIVGSILIPATTKGGNVMESAVKRPFTADAAYNNEITNNFYSKLDKLKQAATDKNITQKLSSKLVTPEEKMNNLYASMTRHISDIRDGITQLGSTDEAREKQQQLLDILTELNKPIDYNQANRLKTQLIVMAREYKK